MGVLQFLCLFGVFFRTQDGGFLSSFVTSGHMGGALSVFKRACTIKSHLVASQRCDVSFIFSCPCCFLRGCQDVQKPLPTIPVVDSSVVEAVCFLFAHAQ